MKGLQLLYTSCRRGLSSGPGFQIRALTPGIGPEEQREIERRGVYRPPRTADPTPSDEAIARDFPRALRYYPLTSGRRALTLTGYAGRDYSGRWGNFFAHTLVFDGPPPPLWPIDYYEWEGWRHRLLPDEDTDQPPPVPPVVDLGELVPAESFTLTELSAFLAEEAGRPELLALMGRAALAAGGSSRSVVVRDTFLRGLYWIACVQKLFPPAHALTLWFSTYQDDPRGAATLNATVEGTDFTFTEAERRFRFAMFDLVTGTHSEIEGGSDYPSLAARWLAEDPRKLEAFFEFMGHFDHEALDGADLLAAATLFQLQRGECERLDGERLAAVLTFAGRFTAPAGRVSILERLSAALLEGPSLPEPAHYAAAVRFLAEGAAATGQPRHRAAAFELWRRLFREAVIDRGHGVEAARDAWRELGKILADYGTELAERYLGAGIGEQAGERAATLQAPALTLTLELASGCLARLDRGPFLRQADWRSLITAWIAARTEVEAAAGAVFEALPNGAEPLSEAVELLLASGRAVADPAERERALGRALGRHLARLPQSAADEVRRGLDDRRRWEVLFGEWQALSGGAADLGRFFDEYRERVLDSLPGYAEEHGPGIAASALDRLPPADQARRAAGWLLNGAVEGFPLELRRRCIELANDALGRPGDVEDPDGLASAIEKSAARDRVPLRPDRPLIRRLTAAAASGDLRLGSAERARLPAALDGLGAAEYGHFLEAYLPAALGRVGNAREHGRALLAAWSDSHVAVFRRVYCGFLSVQRGRDGLTPLQTAVKYWLHFDETDGDAGRLATLRPSALDELVRTARRLPARRWDVVREGLEKSRLAAEPRRRWRELEQRIAERPRGLFGRVRQWLGRGRAPAGE